MYATTTRPPRSEAEGPKGIEESGIHLVSVSSPSMHLSAWTATACDAEALAEALYEARPQWHISIDGMPILFSPEGKVADYVTTT